MLAVYVCVNKKYLPLFKIFYESFIERASITQKYDFYCFTDSVEVSDVIKSDPRYSGVIVKEAAVTKIDNYTQWDDDFYYGMSIKIFALYHLYPRYSRVLYFDVDLVINGEIDSLVNMDMQGYSCAGVPDFAYHRWDNPDDSHVAEDVEVRTLLIGDHKKYINSGVYLIDCTKKKKLLNYDRFSDEHRPRYIDQDYLNTTFKDDVLIIDETYNFMCDLVFMGQMTNDHRLLAHAKMSQAKVQHFHGTAKPWLGRETHGFKNVVMQADTRRFYEIYDRLGIRDWFSDNIEANRMLYRIHDNISDKFK